MSQVLRQSTQVVVRIGPAVAVADGFTPVTTLALGTADEAELLKAAGAATVSIAGNTFAAITGADGWYDLTLSTTDTNTVGTLEVVINDDSLCLPIHARFQVVEEAAYDAIYAASAAPATAAGVSAVETDTQDLQSKLGTPSDLGGGATVAANLVTIEGQTDDIGAAGAGLTALATAAALATVQADTDNIQTRLPAALVGGRMDASVGANAAGVITSAAFALDAIDAAAIKADAAQELADALLDRAAAIEGLTPRELLRLMAAALLGKASGLDTGAPAVYRDLADTKDRISVTCDEDGNRSAVTLDASA